MSKNKKAPKGKSTKSVKDKKPLKKAVKPAAKKAPAKKSGAAAAKSSAKRKQPTIAKKTAPKKAVKTKVKSVKAKPVAAPKKSTSKIVAKPVKPIAKAKDNSKKIVAKKTPAKVAKPNKNDKATKIADKKAIVPKEIKTKAAPKSAAPVKPVAEVKLKKTEEPAKKSEADKKNQDVLAITNTIPVPEKPVISASRIASISHSITNPVKRSDSYSVRVEKEPAGKFEMEFVVHASAEMLYEFLSTPSGLSEWFCDDLNIRNGIYTFIWEDTLQQARLLKTVDLQLVRFQWVDKTDGSYFEFRIQRDDLTNDISIIITDFAESASERESAKLLWNNQIEKLMHVIGSVF